MPLGCDCYPGCWGDHSNGWPEVPYTKERAKRAANELPCGSYVIVGNEYTFPHTRQPDGTWYDYSKAVIRVERERYASELLSVASVQALAQTQSGDNRND